MKKTLFVACCACAALAFCGRAAANVTFGITEDTGVLGDPTIFYSTLNDLGATENRIAINWDPAQPTTIPNQPGLDYWLPQATIHADHATSRRLASVGVGSTHCYGQAFQKSAGLNRGIRAFRLRRTPASSGIRGRGPTHALNSRRRSPVATSEM